jgi:hypothetical protein
VAVLALLLTSWAADTLRAGPAVAAVAADGATAISAMAATMAGTTRSLNKENGIFRGNIAIPPRSLGRMLDQLQRTRRVSRRECKLNRL